MSSLATSCVAWTPFKAAAAHSNKHIGPRRGVQVVRAAQQERQAADNVSRRAHLAALLTAAAVLPQAPPAQAIGFKKELKRRKIPLEEYTDLPGTNGLKAYELAAGNGPEVKEGSDVTVHFDCWYKGINAVSSRSARTLGGNRTVAEPFEFVAASPVSGTAAKKISDGANGMFAGTGGPKPPPALSTAVLGMRVGGKRSVIVPADQGYGDKGEQEIPPGATFELQIEVLGVKA